VEPEIYFADAVTVRIGVVSDTHIPGRARSLPAALLSALKGSDLIVHAGDLNALSVLDTLASLAPVVAVAGNTDADPVHLRLGRRRLLIVAGCRIGLVHGDGSSGTTQGRALQAFCDEAVDCVVFGHSHIPKIERSGAILCVNPGSPTDKRSQPFYTCARLNIDRGVASAEIIPLSGKPQS